MKTELQVDLSQLKQNIKRWQKRLNNKELHKKDAIKLTKVFNYIKNKEYRNAIITAQHIDTSPREMIPTRLYNFIKYAGDHKISKIS